MKESWCFREVKNRLKWWEHRYHQVEHHPRCFSIVWLLQVSMWIEEGRIASLQNPDKHTPHKTLQLTHKDFKCSDFIGVRLDHIVQGPIRFLTFIFLKYVHKHSELKVLTLDTKVIRDYDDEY